MDNEVYERLKKGKIRLYYSLLSVEVRLYFKIEFWAEIICIL